eukprot:364703-Chlamydomonas_euryale.AAC.5
MHGVCTSYHPPTADAAAACDGNANYVWKCQATAACAHRARLSVAEDVIRLRRGTREGNAVWLQESSLRGDKGIRSGNTLCEYKGVRQLVVPPVAATNRSLTAIVATSRQPASQPASQLSVCDSQKQEELVAHEELVVPSHMMAYHHSRHVCFACACTWKIWVCAARNGVPLVTAPSMLLDPLCLAAFNTFVGPLPVTLTLNLRVWTPRVGPIPLCLAAFNTDMPFVGPLPASLTQILCMRFRVNDALLQERAVSWCLRTSGMHFAEGALQHHRSKRCGISEVVVCLGT